MRRRPARQDPETTEQANQEFYRRHPERDPDNGGQGIDPVSRDDARMREEWMDIYEQSGGETEIVPLNEPPLGCAVQPCRQSWIHIIVVDNETGRRIPNAVVLLKPSGGEPTPCRLNENGEHHFSDVSPGTWELLNAPLVAGQNVHDIAVRQTTQGIISPVTIESLDHLPEDSDLDDGSREESNEEHQTQAVLVSKVKEHYFSEGERLGDVASRGGWTEAEFLRFNFGPLEDPEERRQALLSDVGVLQFDEYDDPVFSGWEVPGRMWYLDQEYSAQLATEKVHIIKVEAVERPFRLELETVDEVGHRLPSQSLRLLPTCGEPIEIQTNELGYWSADEIRIAGLLTFEQQDGQLLYFAIGGQYRTDLERQQAVINPLLMYRGLISLSRQRRTEEVRARRRELRRRYFLPRRTVESNDFENDDSEIRHPSDLEQLVFRPGEDSDGSPIPDTDTPLEQPNRRLFRNSTDNVFVAAGWREGEDSPPISRLVQELEQFFFDYHPTGTSRLRKPIFIIVSGSVVRVIGPEHDVLGEFRLGDGVEIRDYGGYVDYVSGGRINPYLDIVERRFIISKYFQNGHRVNILRQQEPEFFRLLLEEDEYRFNGLMRSYPLNPRVLYIFPPDYGTWSLLARNGGSGFLEEYPPSAEDSALFERVHQRNLNVMGEVRWAYEAYLSWYVAQVEEIPDQVRSAPEETDDQGRSAPEPARMEAALRRLGPPNSPFRFPMPASLDKNVPVEERAMLGIAQANSEPTALRAWRAISAFLDTVWDRQSDGSIRFVAKFEPQAGGRMHLGPDIDQRVGPARARFLAGYGRVANMKLETNAAYDPAQNQLIAGSNTVLEVGEDVVLAAEAGASSFLLGKLKAEMEARGSRLRETELSTGDYKNTLKVEFGASAIARVGPPLIGRKRSQRIRAVELEISDNGDYEFTMDRFISVIPITVGGNTLQYNTFIGSCHDVEGPGIRRSAGVASVSGATSGKICFGVRVQLLRPDTIIAFLTRAPGFFERMSWYDVVRVGMTWNHLTQDTQEALYIIGWTDPDLWDRRHSLLADEWPEATRTRWVDLQPVVQVAAIALGIRGDESNRNWVSSWNQIEAWPGIEGGDTLEGLMDDARDLVPDGLSSLTEGRQSIE